MAAFVLEHGRLWSVGVRGYAMIPDGLPLDEGVIGRAVRTSAAQLVLDVTRGPGFRRGLARDGLRARRSPLVMPTGIVGVLNIETSVPLPAGSAMPRLPSSLRGPGRPDGRAARLAHRPLVARATLRLHELAPRPAPRSPRSPFARSAACCPSRRASCSCSTTTGSSSSRPSGARRRRRPSPCPSRSLQALRERIDASAVFELLDTTAVAVPELAGPQAPLGGADPAARERRGDRPARRRQPLRARVRPWPGRACLAARRACGGVARRGGRARPRAPRARTPIRSRASTTGVGSRICSTASSVPRRRIEPS